MRIGLGIAAGRQPHGGGGGSPELPTWVQDLADLAGATPLAAIDFQAGNYFMGGAVSSVGEMLEQNDNWAQFNPVSIVSGSGLTNINSNGNPALTPAVFSLLAGPFYTVLVRTFIPVSSLTSAGSGLEGAQFPGYDTEAGINVTPAVNCGFYAYDLDNDESGALTQHNNALVCGAYTLSPSFLGASIQGEAVVSATAFTPDPAINTLVMYSPSVADAFLRVIAIWDPLDQSVLQALSAAP